jgi:hypothetical protein
MDRGNMTRDEIEMVYALTKYKINIIEAKAVARLSKSTRKFFYRDEIQDPRLLGNDVGRITIYEECVSYTDEPSQDHNDLLLSMITEWGLQKEQDAVISGASKYYYIRKNDKIIVSPARRIDSDDFYDNKEQYTRLILSAIK